MGDDLDRGWAGWGGALPAYSLQPRLLNTDGEPTPLTSGDTDIFRLFRTIHIYRLTMLLLRLLNTATIHLLFLISFPCFRLEFGIEGHAKSCY